MRVNMIKDKIVVITGAANGIGYATALTFLKEGAYVIIADISEEEGKKAQADLSAQFNNRCLFVKTDTSNETDIINMCIEAKNNFGNISILVNGAAKFIMKGIEATPEDWNSICMVNIAGYALCAKHCLPHMKDVGYGSIINICSISADIAQSSFVTYSATKGAVASMTRCMALDLAKFNIRVNAVSPGTVWTESNMRFHKETLNMTREQADAHPEIGGLHILGRTADPEEISEVILFLASKSASYITATNITVDGGYTAK
jgi:NAD(P)-dependent dehydrogenase (short-subunit alcohol dehydrogenase family)